MPEINSLSLKIDAAIKAYYRMELAALTTDSSGNGKTLTNNGPVLDGVGRYGGGADHGITGTKYFKIAENLGIGGQGAISISFWIKLNAEIGVSFYGLFTHLSQTTAKREFTLTYNYNAGTRQLSLNSAGAYVNSNQTLGTTSWHHIVATRAAGAGGAFILYLDNVPLGNNTTASTTGASEDSFTIGNVSSGDANFSTYAVIDDVAVFGKVLTVAEIDTIFKAKSSGFAAIL